MSDQRTDVMMKHIDYNSWVVVSEVDISKDGQGMTYMNLFHMFIL